MSTTDPTPPVAGDDATKDLDPVPGVGEMPTPREIVTVITVFIWSLVIWWQGETQKGLVLWGGFFGMGLLFDLIDVAFRFHYRKVSASQILWWLQPHYVVAAFLGIIVDWVYPVNYSLSFVVSITVGVIVSIPVEKYYVSLTDQE